MDRWGERMAAEVDEVARAVWVVAAAAMVVEVA